MSDHSDEDQSELLQSLVARIEFDVRAGFKEEKDIMRSVELEFDEDKFDAALLKELEAHIHRLMRKQRDAEASWVEPTTNDRIDQTFDELNAKGIVALQNPDDTFTGSWSVAEEVASGLPTPPRGAVFYHSQDLERSVRGGGLYLAYGSYDEDPQVREAASLVIARELRETLARHGVKTVWDGSVKSRILIPPFEWRKRRFKQGPRSWRALLSRLLKPSKG